MSLALQDASATLFLRGLNVLSGLVDKAVQSGLDEAAIMDARLAPDMKPLPDQVRMAAFSARSCVARLTGQDWPKTDDSEATLAELKATIALSIAFIEATDAAAFEGGETRRIEIRFPGVELDFGRGVSDQLRPAELLLPRQHGLRHPAQCRGRTGQAGLSRHAGAGLTSGADKGDPGSYTPSHIVRPAS